MLVLEILVPSQSLCKDTAVPLTLLLLGIKVLCLNVSMSRTNPRLVPLDPQLCVVIVFDTVFHRYYLRPLQSAPANIKSSVTKDDEAAAMAAMFQRSAADWEETQEKMSQLVLPQAVFCPM